jgi:hypothetical protein
MSLPASSTAVLLLLHRVLLVLQLSSAGGLAAPMREHQIPFLSACSARSTTQAWQVEAATGSVSRIRLGTSSTCLCAYLVRPIHVCVASVCVGACGVGVRDNCVRARARACVSVCVCCGGLSWCFLYTFAGAGTPRSPKTTLA